MEVPRTWKQIEVEVHCFVVDKSFSGVMLVSVSDKARTRKKVFVAKTL